MIEIITDINLHEVLIPIVCFGICIGFQVWEALSSHSEIRARSLFQTIRTGWIKDNFMGGPAAVNTTRDYIKSATFFANSAITLATFTVGYAGTRYADCSAGENCRSEDWLLMIKLGLLAGTLLSIFFLFTQCTRFAVHFSFCINTRELDGVPTPHCLLVNTFNHTHTYYSLGIRLYFGTIPVFAWIFTAWALLGITPLYLYVVRGLENAKFVQGDMDAMDSSRANLTACAPQEERAPPSGNKTSQTETQGYNTGTYDTDQYNTGNYHNAHKHSYTQQRIASSGDDVERNMATKQL